MTVFVCVCLYRQWNRYQGTHVTSSEEKERISDLEKNIIKLKAQLYDIDQTLPQKNGTYLKVRMQNLLGKIPNKIFVNDKSQETTCSKIPHEVKIQVFGVYYVQQSIALIFDDLLDFNLDWNVIVTVLTTQFFCC